MGCLDVIDLIDESWDAIALRPAHILQLYRDLLRRTGKASGSAEDCDGLAIRPAFAKKPPCLGRLLKTIFSQNPSALGLCLDYPKINLEQGRNSCSKSQASCSSAWQAGQASAGSCLLKFCGLQVAVILVLTLGLVVLCL